MTETATAATDSETTKSVIWKGETMNDLHIELAEEIAEDIFTNGHGERAKRLVMIDPAGRDLGGWCVEAVKSRIEKILSVHPTITHE